MIVASKSALHKVLVEEDLAKSPEYESVRVSPHISSLMNERDKAVYRQRVRCNSASTLVLIFADYRPETFTIAWVFN